MSNENKEWKEVKQEYHGSSMLVNSDWGPIDFLLQGMNEFVGSEKRTHDEYLDLFLEEYKSGNFDEEGNGVRPLSEWRQEK